MMEILEQMEKVSNEKIKLEELERQIIELRKPEKSDKLEKQENYKKNEEATYNLLTLLEYMMQRQDIDNLVGASLMEKVISGFEDEEIDIPYKGNDVFKLLSCSDEGFNKSYKSNIVEALYGDFFTRNHHINIVQMLATNSLEWAKELLVSNISLEKRLEMFYDILEISEDINLDSLFERNLYLKRTPKEVYNLKMRELLIAFLECKTDHNIKTFYNEVISQNVKLQGDIKYSICKCLIKIDNSIEASNLNKMMKK